MTRLLVAVTTLTLAVGCNCGLTPVQDCSTEPCPDGGTGGGTAGGQAGGSAGGDAGGAAGGDAGGAAGGDAGGSAGGSAGGTAGGTAGGAAGGAAGGSAGGAAGGSAGGAAGGSAGGAGGGTSGSYYAVCVEQARRRCDFAARCKADRLAASGGLQHANAPSPASETAKCIQAEAAALNCQQVEAAVDGGRLGFDQTNFTACLDAVYPAASCPRDAPAALAACDTSKYLSPKVAAGGTCLNDVECQSGFCNVPQNATCGTCAPYVNADGGVGAGCQRAAQCDPSRSYCPGNGFQPCQAFTAVDAGCGGTAECGPGNVCTLINMAQARCFPGKAEGAVCTMNRLECARTAGTYELICVPTSTSAAGQGVCTKRWNSAPVGTCNNGETAGPTTGSLGPLCLESEYCAQGLCTTRRTTGQPCTSVDQCGVGLRCTNVGMTAGTCQPFQDLGATCASSDQCKSLLLCAAGACVAGLSSLSGACGGNQPPLCAEGYCAQGGTGAQCTALKADGATCQRSNECQSLACVQGACARACWR